MGPILTVDIAVTIGRREIVLIRRAKPPFMDRLVLPGGHVEDSDASLAAAAARELLEETGIAVSPEDLRLMTVLDAPGRDPRPGRRVSVVFTVDLPRKAFEGGAAASDAAQLLTRPLAGLREDEIGFDHFAAVKLLGKGRGKMKVLKEGKWNNPWELEVVCPSPECGATLLIGEKDVIANGHLYGTCSGYSVACPVCGKWVDLPAKEISPRVKRAAEDRRPTGGSSSWD